MPESAPQRGSPDVLREPRYTITDLAREFDITTRTMRFYEDLGLLSPRRQGNARVYSPRDRVRLKLVLRGKRLGFSLKEISDIIAMYDAEPGEAGQLDYMLKRLAQQRSLLERRRRDIEVSLEELDQLERQCRARLAAMQPGR